MEPRSEDESDAGSLVDFICDSDEESESDSAHSADDDAVDEKLVVESYTRSASGARRSTRVRQAPTRYVDDQWVELMTDDAEIDDVLSDSDVDKSQSQATEDSDYSDHHDASSDSSSDVEEAENDDDSEASSSYDSEDA